MAVEVRVRGWLECDARQMDEIRRIVLADANADYYSDGWALPSGVRSWTSYAFFGHDIRATSLPWFIDLIGQIARVPASDEDNDLVVGYFLLTHDVDGTSEIFVRDGELLSKPARRGLEYLDT